jgi:hypothetical protein
MFMDRGYSVGDVNDKVYFSDVIKLDETIGDVNE